MSGNNYSTSSSNLQTEHGYGEWVVVLYNPEGPCGLFKGYLTVSKDFHTIYNFRKTSENTADREKKVLASFPSQNIAYVFDKRHIENWQE